MIRRLKALIKDRKTSANAVTKAAGLGNTAVHDIIHGKSKRPMQDVLTSIADVLNVDVAYLIGVSNTQRVAHEPPRMAIPVIGAAKTGAWLPMFLVKNVTDANLLLLRKVDGLPHPKYPGADHFALDIADDSMDRVGLVPGAVALCIDVIGVAETGGKALIESGSLYAVRLTDERGQQTFIRRIVLHGDRYELQPDSTNSKFRAISCRGKPSTNPKNPVCIFGHVYRLERDLTSV